MMALQSRRSEDRKVRPTAVNKCADASLAVGGHILTVILGMCNGLPSKIYMGREENLKVRCG